MLDILVQPRRDKRAAKRFFRNLLKGLKYRVQLPLTNLAGTPQRRKNCCLWLSIVGIDGLTTERRAATNRPENGSTACGDSKTPGMRNAPCLPSG
jgi:transposase-like protein